MIKNYVKETSIDSSNQTSKSYYTVKNIYVNVYEDSYEKGEGKRVQSYDIDYLNGKKFKSLNDLVIALEDYIGNKEYWNLSYMNEYEEYAEIFSSIITDADGDELSPNQLSQWKAGKIKGYSTQFHVLVSKVIGIMPVPAEEFIALGITEL